MEGYDYAKCVEISKQVRWDKHPRFRKTLGELITEAQGERINNALGLIR